ncbi:MAG: trypsin-like peptidase domain-containing protein [Candidatus Hydrogenedentes bacterium]|nr:trypsin-like peptidase domain-containing protein [Candidatus Hydrogenedentota bacterium]
MKRMFALSVACVLLATGCVTTGSGMQRAVTRAKDKVSPALVHIRPVKEVFSGGKREEISVVGSGFIISPDGYVVTNEHVAGESTLVRCVLSNKEEVDAEVIGTDRYTDLALLKLVTDSKDLPSIHFAPPGKVEAGQVVLALGSPHGLARSVSMGIVSVTDRYLGDREEMVSPYNTWIQTDAAINPGNSGGPLVNLKGDVVGVNARRLGGADNVGFAIPAATAIHVIDQLREKGRVQRSWLGLTVQETTSKTDDPNQKGVVIADVDPLSPATDAGVRPGDILLSVNGKPTDARYVEDLPDVRRLMADLPVGSQVKLQIARGNEQIEIPLTTVERDDLTGEEVEFPEWGFTATDLTPTIIRRAQLASNQGVYISGTQVGSVAANSGLVESDVVLMFDGAVVENLKAFREMYAQRVESKQRLILLQVKRGALTRFVLVKQEESTEAQTELPQQDGGVQDEE